MIVYIQSSFFQKHNSFFLLLCFNLCEDSDLGCLLYWDSNSYCWNGNLSWMIVYIQNSFFPEKYAVCLGMLPLKLYIVSILFFFFCIKFWWNLSWLLQNLQQNLICCSQVKTREQREAEVIPKLSEALKHGISVMDNAFVTVELTTESELLSTLLHQYLSLIGYKVSFKFISNRIRWWGRRWWHWQWFPSTSYSGTKGWFWSISQA